MYAGGILGEPVRHNTGLDRRARRLADLTCLASPIITVSALRFSATTAFRRDVFSAMRRNR